MSSIPKKVSDRFLKKTKKFQRILKNANDRDINEADTVTIVGDIFTEVFGYDKYEEITSEFAVRGTYCDLAIQIDDNIKYLIEVKAIGTDLKESHLRQAVNYGANKGVQWIILTNGILWEIYFVRFEKPVREEKLYSMNFLELNPRKIKDQEYLFLLCKEGINKAAIDKYQEHIRSVNKFSIAAILFDESVINIIRRKLKKIALDLKIDNLEIEDILKNEVIKRDVIEGEEAEKGMLQAKKAISKTTSEQRN
ncbi:type I restriction enzyme HsdR N-terminal domain-containing protein [Chlamydiota bacterium]